nr:NPC intracellular cholesterol transporter 2-like [Pocillopora verrucosa]
MKAVVFLLVSLLAVVSCKKISYQKCPSTKELGEIVSIDVTPCEEEPCVLKKGSNETVTITFIPHEVVTGAKIYAYAIKGPIHVRLPVPNPNACQDHGLSCPLKSGVQVEFVLVEFVSPSVPSGDVKLEAQIKDQDGKSLICGIVKLHIQ